MFLSPFLHLLFCDWYRFYERDQLAFTSGHLITQLREKKWIFWTFRIPLKRNVQKSQIIMHKLLSDQQGLHYWFTFGSFVVRFLWFVPCVSAQCVLWICVNTFQLCHHFLHKNYDLIILLSGLASLQGTELLHVSDCIPSEAEGRLKLREPSHIAGWPTECQVMSGLNKPACAPHYWYLCLTAILWLFDIVSSSGSPMRRPCR